MTKYEYCARVDNFHLDVLNAMGADSWRYVEQRSGPPGVNQVVMFFEREVQEQDVSPLKATKKQLKEVVVE